MLAPGAPPFWKSAGKSDQRDPANAAPVSHSAAARAVEPVVNTSSTKTTSAPRNRSNAGSRSENAFWTLARRCCGCKDTWVRPPEARESALTQGRSTLLESATASTSPWSYPLSRRRSRDVGTGTTTGRVSSHNRGCKHWAMGSTIAEISSCQPSYFSACTITSAGGSRATPHRAKRRQAGQSRHARHGLPGRWPVPRGKSQRRQRGAGGGRSRPRHDVHTRLTPDSMGMRAPQAMHADGRRKSRKRVSGSEALTPAGPGPEPPASRRVALPDSTRTRTPPHPAGGASPLRPSSGSRDRRHSP